MSKKEIALWFDKAYAYISAGEFAAATAAFEHIINNFDAYASTIAEQRLRWYCVPLQGVFERIQQSSLPINIHEILIELFHLAPQSEEANLQLTIQEIERGLSEITSCVRVGERYWIGRDVFEEMLQFSTDLIQNSSELVTLDNLINEKWVKQDNATWELPDYFTVKVFENNLSRKEIHVLAQGKCYISKSGALATVEAYASLIRNSRNPTKIRDFLASRFPNSPYTNDLEAFFKRNLDARFVEVADGYEFLVELLNLNDAPVEDYFESDFQIVSTTDLLNRMLFPDLGCPPALAPKVLKISKRDLVRNPNIRKIDGDHWMLTRLVQQITFQASEYLKNQDEMINTHEILQNGTSLFQISNEALSLVINFFRSEFQTLPSFNNFEDDQWMHDDALHRLGDQIYNLLLDSSSSLPTRDLLQKLGDLKRVPPVKTIEGKIEKMLLRDERVYGEKKGAIIYWQINSPSRRYYDLCYQTLLSRHLPLFLTELVSSLPEEYQAKNSSIDLTLDPRFAIFPDDKWGLSQWTWLNDLAYDYIARTHQHYHSNVLVGLICRENHIHERDAIFIPDEDPRFVKDSINRWSIIYKLTDEEINLIYDELVKNMGIGGSLGNILKRIIHLPIEMTNARKVLAEDNRFISLDGKWFAREIAFYQLADSDLNVIFEFITSLQLEQLPISIKVLIRETLGKDFRLTDAADKLGLDNRFVEYYDGFWASADFTPPEITRSPHLLSTGRGKSYRSDLLDNGENQFPEELTARKNPPTDETVSKPTKKKEYIVLSHLDILHGNLRIFGLLKSLIEDSQQNAVHFVDEENFEFVGLLDETKSILHIKPWLERRQLTFGDKISIQIDHPDGVLLIQPYGERDQRVYQEATQHQDLERLIEDARLVNKSYHDLIIEVMDAIGTPLHREDIFQLVDYQRTASRSTIFEVLSLVDCPYEELRYFVPSGKGYWYFDRKRKEAYDMKMLELEQQNSSLANQVDQLTLQIENQKSLIEEPLRLQYVQQIQELEEKVSRLENKRNEIEGVNRKLQQDIVDREQGIVEQFSAQMKQLQDQNKNLAENLASLNEKNAALEAKISSLETERTEQEEILSEYHEKEELWENNLKSLESKFVHLQTEYQILREQSAVLTEKLDDEKEHSIILENENAKVLGTLQEKLSLSATELEASRQKLSEYEERLNQIDKTFASPIGRLLARLLHLNIKHN